MATGIFGQIGNVLVPDFFSSKFDSYAIALVLYSLARLCGESRFWNHGNSMGLILGARRALVIFSIFKGLSSIIMFV